MLNKVDVTTTAALLCIDDEQYLRTRLSSRCPVLCVDPVGMIDMNDSCGFAVSWSTPKELINRLQFGASDLWPEGASTSDRWRFIAQLIDSDRGMLVELGGSVSTRVVEALVATAELCRQSVSESVPAEDWEYLRRALRWLERSNSDVDRALIAVGEELALIGLDGMEQDFSVATWLCMDVLDRFASAGDAVGYWVEYMRGGESNTTEQDDSESIDNDDAALAVAV